MSDERDIDTCSRTDYFIQLLESEYRLTKRERGDIALLLRRWRKQQFGSALTDQEQKAGWAEISP